jgi:hypothetical protein
MAKNILFPNGTHKYVKFWTMYVKKNGDYVEVHSSGTMLQARMSPVQFLMRSMDFLNPPMALRST